MQRGTDSVLTSRAPTKFKMVGHDHSRPCTHAHYWQGRVAGQIAVVVWLLRLYD